MSRDSGNGFWSKLKGLFRKKKDSLPGYTYTDELLAEKLTTESTQNAFNLAYEKQENDRTVSDLLENGNLTWVKSTDGREMLNPYYNTWENIVRVAIDMGNLNDINSSEHVSKMLSMFGKNDVAEKYIELKGAERENYAKTLSTLVLTGVHFDANRMIEVMNETDISYEDPDLAVGTITGLAHLYEVMRNEVPDVLPDSLKEAVKIAGTKDPVKLMEMLSWAGKIDNWESVAGKIPEMRALNVYLDNITGRQMAEVTTSAPNEYLLDRNPTKLFKALLYGAQRQGQPLQYNGNDTLVASTCGLLNGMNKRMLKSLSEDGGVNEILTGYNNGDIKPLAKFVVDYSRNHVLPKTDVPAMQQLYGLIGQSKIGRKSKVKTNRPYETLYNNEQFLYSAVDAMQAVAPADPKAWNEFGKRVRKAAQFLYKH